MSTNIRRFKEGHSSEDHTRNISKVEQLVHLFLASILPQECLQELDRPGAVAMGIVARVSWANSQGSPQPKEK